MSLRAVSQVRQAAVLRGSRSHLAAKNILVTLAQVFRGVDFTSRAASFRLGLDFLYTSKVLSRMAKRPDYYLTVVSRVPRPIGGFENVYMISQRGWNKISYLRSHAAVPARGVGKTFCDSIWDAGFLLYGNGLPIEGIASQLSKVLSRDWKMPAVTDDIGQALITIDAGRAPEEMMLAVMRHWPEGDMLETINRGMYLQKIGLIPESVSIPFYVANNLDRGISGQTILTALIIRGAIELREEVLTLKAKLASTGAKQIETSKRDESLLVGEKKRNEQFGKENASLRKELSDVRFEHFRSGLRNSNLCDYIVSLSRLLFTISEDLNKIEISSFDAMAVKAAVHRWLVVIAVMNALTYNSNKPDA